MRPAAPPATFADARTLAHSDGAQVLIDLAAAIALETKPDRTRFGARDVFWALLVQGHRQSGVESASRWLHEWIEEQAPGRIASAIAPYLDVKPVPVDHVMPLTAHAGALLARASLIAALTVGRTGYDIRHIAAALTFADAEGANENVLGIAQRSFGVDVTGFPSHLLEIIATSRERNESIQAWRMLAASPVPSPSRRATSERRILADPVVNLNADRPSPTGPDPLGIDADVEAFARLICLHEATPPLSIGLFGEWGSGKSSFMERLQVKIKKLTDDTREARQKREAQAPPAAPLLNPPAESETQAAPRFVENVVQIRFNAWHFADANLWASLTAEFFDQLRAGGHARHGDRVHARLVERVNAHIHSLTSTENAARTAVGESEKALVAAQKARDEAVQAVSDAKDETLSQTLVDAVGAAYAMHRPDLVEIGRRAYQDDVAQGIDDFVAVAKQVQTIGGQLKTVAEIVLARGWRVALAVLAVAFVLLAIAGLSLGDKTQATSFLTQIGFWGWLGALASAAGAVLPALKIVAGIVKSTSEFASKLDAVTKDKLKQVIASEVKLKEAIAETQARRAALGGAQAALARYVDPAATANPPRLLRYVLEDDPDTKAFEREIGMISRSRRVFEVVNEIVKEQRKARDKAKPTDLDVPDRIVLYIDDLDRCTHQQVYDVLQAIHLLLAFELFVVVVGVDVRWVEEAVARQFVVAIDDLPENATKDDHEAARKRAETERRKRAIDYLEKIFQLPFWLRRLSTQADGTYEAYVRDLLQANLAVPLDQPGPLGATKTSHAGATDDAAAAPDSDETGDGEATPETATTEASFVALDRALATVRLTQAEVDFLASPEIGALAAKSPRAVKRMINVYRIIRARMGEAELAEFLGQTGKPPTWPIAVFLAAVECGQPVDVADALYDALFYKSDDLLQTYIRQYKSGASKPNAMPNDIFEKIEIFSEAPGLLDGIDKVQSLADPKVLYSGDYGRIARIVRRYSFNRYH